MINHWSWFVKGKGTGDMTDLSQIHTSALKLRLSLHLDVYPDVQPPQIGNYTSRRRRLRGLWLFHLVCLVRQSCRHFSIELMEWTQMTSFFSSLLFFKGIVHLKIQIHSLSAHQHFRSLRVNSVAAKVTKKTLKITCLHSLFTPETPPLAFRRRNTHTDQRTTMNAVYIEANIQHRCRISQYSSLWIKSKMHELMNKLT